MALRAETARREVEQYGEFDFVVVNAEGEMERTRTVERLCGIIDAEKCRVRRLSSRGMQQQQLAAVPAGTSDAAVEPRGGQQEQLLGGSARGEPNGEVLEGRIGIPAGVPSAAAQPAHAAAAWWARR